MKKFIFTLLFLFILTNPVIAQDENVQDQAPVINDVEGLRAEFKQYTQDPESKEVKFELVLKSNLDSDRVRVTWSLMTLDGKGSVFKDPSQSIKFINIQKGQNYTIPITIIPTGKGEVQLLGKVESFKAGATFTVTASKVYASNTIQEILPLTNDYVSARRNVLLKNIAIFVGLFALTIFIFIRGTKQFKIWLNK